MPKINLGVDELGVLNCQRVTSGKYLYFSGIDSVIFDGKMTGILYLIEFTSKICSKLMS